MSRLRPIKIPEIRFQYGWLLTNAFYFLRKQIPKFKKEKPPTWNEMKSVVAERRRLWKKNEKKLITAMQKISGLNFYQNLIDVYLISGYGGAFSDPLTMNIKKYEGERFVDILTHEILHRLLTDNIQNKNGGSWPYKAYPRIKDKTTLHHILVHAIHKEIYLAVLKRPDRLKRDMEECQKWPSYKRAWDIVEQDGHMNIIERFKKFKV